MDFNIIAYIIYLPIMVFITVRLGYTFYKNGRLFILKQLNNDIELTDAINKMLLIGYYLINLGYCFYIVSQWNTLESWEVLLSSLSQTIGYIVLGLGLMHFINVAILFFLGKQKQAQQIKNQINNNH